MSNKICMYPFTRIETGKRSYTPCCYHWLTPEYHNLAFDSSDLWNSPAAIELRSRIFKGDYSLCRRDVCNIPLKTIEDIKLTGSGIDECPVDPRVLNALKYQESQLSYGPTSVAVLADRRCNLACPSCRDEKILKLRPEEKKYFFDTITMLKKYRSSLQSIKMAGDGEVFFSPWLRKLLKICHPGNFPNIKEINILTNGILCTPEMFNKLRPGTDFISEISVSMDAGNEKTYKITRGGDWNRLMKNLEFIAGLRAKNKIKRFIISFVLRKDNLASAEDFINIGHRYGADMIYFLTYDNWHNSKLDYADQAIHYSSHPSHNLFLDFYHKNKNAKNVFMGINPLEATNVSI